MSLGDSNSLCQGLLITPLGFQKNLTRLKKGTTLILLGSQSFTSIDSVANVSPLKEPDLKINLEISSGKRISWLLVLSTPGAQVGCFFPSDSSEILLPENLFLFCGLWSPGREFDFLNYTLLCWLFESYSFPKLQLILYKYPSLFSLL